MCESVNVLHNRMLNNLYHINYLCLIRTSVQPVYSDFEISPS
jgi:hypothetical protein